MNGGSRPQARGRDVRARKASGLALLAMLAACYAGCGQHLPRRMSDYPSSAPPAASRLPPGRRVLLESGCLACHRVGREGNRGPGPALTHVAARLPPRQIAGVLRNPTSPMPSFRHLPRAEFRALVRYLATLR